MKKKTPKVNDKYVQLCHFTGIFGVRDIDFSYIHREQHAYTRVWRAHTHNIIYRYIYICIHKERDRFIATIDMYYSRYNIFKYIYCMSYIYINIYLFDMLNCNFYIIYTYSKDRFITIQMYSITHIYRYIILLCINVCVYVCVNPTARITFFTFDFSNK